MKKLVIFILTAMAVMNVWAQADELKDLIYKSDNEVIEAKVLEVSSSEIKYKDWNNQSGPTFVLTAAEISKVQFSNGTERTFKAAAPAAPAVAAPVAPVQTASESSQPGQSVEKQKMPMGFQANVDVEGNLAFASERIACEDFTCTTNNYARGGVDLILGAGVRMAKFLYVGAAAGVLGEWGTPNVNEYKAKKTSYIVPIYADARVYAPAASGCYPYAEIGIGGYVGLYSNLNIDGVDYAYKQKGDFYLITGVGLEFKYFNLGAGYKFVRNGDGSIQSRSHGYVRIGISLGRPQKLR